MSLVASRQIDSGLISVIVQGPVIRSQMPDDDPTKRCIDSIRRVLPGAEIILSSWRGADISGLSCDRVILNEDPGNFSFGDLSSNNVNRQIVSTRQGLCVATRPFAVKIRTDTVLRHNGFIKYFGSVPHRSEKYRFFKDRIVSSARFFRNPRRYQTLYHVGDIFHFGRTEDLIDLWDIPLAPRVETENWDSIEEPPNKKNWWFSVYFRYTSEQHIWITYLRKKGIAAELRYSWQIAPSAIVESEQSMVNNFLLVDDEALGLELVTKLSAGDPRTIYRPDRWRMLCRLYADRDIEARWRVIFSVYFNFVFRYVIRLARVILR